MIIDLKSRLSKMTNVIVSVKDFQSSVAAQVQGMQEKGDINFPINYSPQNALKSAFLIIQQTVDKNKKFALDVCTKESVANALLDMVVQGLSPAKKQVYFIVRGNVLTMMRSYHGTTAVTKRVKGISDVYAEAVYKDDEFEFEIKRGAKKIVKHVQTLDSINEGTIVAGYCTITKDNGDEYSDVMTMKQIKTAWNRGQTKGGSSAHKEQPEEMAKRSVINRTCKTFLNTSDDSDLDFDALNVPNPEETEVKEETEKVIEAQANTGDIIDVAPEPTPIKDESESSEAPY
jgi:recombination protein RecT